MSQEYQNLSYINKIRPESSTTKFKDINTVVTKTILSDAGKRARILYAGPHPQLNNNLVLYKIIELMRGSYFLEETTFNPQAKSVHSVVCSLSKERFHKLVDPKKLIHESEYHPNPELITGVSYVRQLEDSSRIVANSFVDDNRMAQFRWRSTLSNWCLYREISKYLKNKY